MKAKIGIAISWGFILLTLCLFLVILYQEKKLEGPHEAFAKENEDMAPPSDLHPVVAEKSDQLIEEAEKKNIQVVITDDFRTSEDQDSLYDKGRESSGRVVTHAKGGESYHNYGLAIDFALKTDNGDVIWDLDYDGNNNGEADWMEVVAIAKDLGFTWGGDWTRFKDYPHLQMDFGYSINDLQRGAYPHHDE
ncbi:M15 family metallopeptidase [Alkalicoccobacillus murimartini]|uniref:Peptidoglycan L-alanyl-D-glutamate endopeptidase CwlK n=1 Tax=Alkalicoccobacillus murimartini TaxID=171685 RepID=A0ABT9YIT7_9BACI|nr:M15 family metallopeptidase [Alkalicoccobacillus murimartini]MDQ0207775.1 peptidoglycan L-alanyl-D-glutamate endopeptidase CwlK [Alkalicoccobacillus murimartini]